MRHSQCTTNPLNPPYQGDFGNFAQIEVIGKCYLFLEFTIVKEETWLKISGLIAWLNIGVFHNG